MKKVQSVFVVLAFLVGVFGFCQEGIKTKSDVKITELGITVDALSQLKTIDWQVVFSVFEQQDQNSEISLYVRLKNVDVLNDKDDEVSFTNVKYAVSGFVHEKDVLKDQLQEVIKRLLKKYRDN